MRRQVHDEAGDARLPDIPSRTGSQASRRPAGLHAKEVQAMNADFKNSRDEEDDDVDVWVSPRKFGGTTPSAKAYLKSKNTAAAPFKSDDSAKAQTDASHDSSYPMDTDIESKLCPLVLAG